MNDNSSIMSLTVYVYVTMNCFPFSDAMIANLEPLDPPPFNISNLDGFSATHLDALVKLTFLSDEKYVFLDKKQKSSKIERSDSPSSKAEASALMKKLDEDIARVLNQDLSDSDNDHNADKRGCLTLVEHLIGAGNLLNEMSSEVGAISEDTVTTPSVEMNQNEERMFDITETERIDNNKYDSMDSTCDSRSENMSELQNDDQGEGNDLSLMPDAECNDEDVSNRGTEARKTDAEIKIEQKFELLKKLGIQSIKYASLQVTSLKALFTIVSSNKFSEMLLVPKADLSAQSNKALLDGTVVRKDEDFKCILRSMMKSMIKRAVNPSPFHRVVSLHELERGQSMLHTLAVTAFADEKTQLGEVQGIVSSLLLNS